MWIQTPGEIEYRLVFLGTRQNCLYLLRGDRYLLIGGGGPWVVPTLESQFREYRIDMDRVEYLLIGHTHFDHCGAVPYLKKRYPHIKVVASRGAAQVFGKEKAVRIVRGLNRQVMKNIGLPMEFAGTSLDFDGVHLAQDLKEGDLLDLGDGLQLRVFETPGHSICAMTVYEPERNWLFPSDSLHFPAGNGKEFMPTVSESFSQYLNSLRKLENLKIRLCAWEHHGVMKNHDAENIVKKGINFTIHFKDQILKLLARLKDPDKVADFITRDWLEKTHFEFLTYDVMFNVAQNMVKKAVEEKIDF
jgi:glyoxylase-like metal-dependent hydrolase (beta-lactamase superfamily II)